MTRRAVSGVVLMLLLISMLTSIFMTQPVKAVDGTIYIRADGSVDPPTAPILNGENVYYTFTADIYDSIVIERENIILDGQGHSLQGTSSKGGIDLMGRRNVTIQNIQIRQWGMGIVLWEGASGNSILGNSITDNEDGIALQYECNDNIISGNNIANNNRLGIWVEQSESNSISGNSISANDKGGLWLSSSSGNSVSGNVFVNDGVRVYDSYGNSVANNWVNGKPLVYLEGVSDYAVADAGQVVLVDCNRVKMANLDLSHTLMGVQLFQTENTEISGNNIANNNWHGIRLIGSSNNVMSENNIANNNGMGISLYGDSNTVSGNNIVGNNAAGVESHGSSNSIFGNNIANNNWGIWFGQSSNNIISGNDVTDNNEWGIVLWSYSSNNVVSGNNIANNPSGIFLLSSSYNRFYHNNFVDNTQQVTGWYINTWDDGYPSGGNYWSDYIGVDSNGDGIGDTPYIIDADNRDRYPLMNPWIPPATQKTLTVYSSPSGVSFTANGVSHTTPWSGTYDSGDSVSLVMPSAYSAGDPRYYWDQWSDGVTSQSRTIVMNSDETVTGCYTGPYYELIVASSPMSGIPFTVNGVTETTSYSEWLYQGYYTIEMPVTYNGYAWQHWLEDGDTDRTRTVSLTYSAMFTAVYAVPDFSVTHDPLTYELRPRTISPGQSATFSISVRSLHGFSEEVSLSYSIASNTGWKDRDLALTLNPSSVTPQPDGAAESTLTVSTSHSLENAIYTIIVWGQCEDKARSTSITLAVAKYELFYEIDYMESHRPRDSVLNYIQNYYIQHGISLSFFVNDTVPYDPEVTDEEFWTIEKEFNDWGDDSANGDYKNAVYYSKWKWVLYCERYEDPDYAGFCSVPLGWVRGWPWEGLKESMTPKASTSGGNYLLIACMYAGTEEAETRYLMHEMGHSIGILMLKWDHLHREYRELYDTDRTSVMAGKNYLWNTGIDPHYSDKYWEERDLDYYKVEKA